MNLDASSLVRDLQHADDVSAELSNTLKGLNLSDFHTLLTQTLAAVNSADESSQHAWLRPVCESLMATLKATSTAQQNTPNDAQLVQIATTIANLYSALGPHHRPRYQLLGCLAQIESNDPAPLKMFVDRIVSDPPAGVGPATAPFVHLCRPHSPAAIAAMYPQLLDALENPEIAPAVLDLANFLTRNGYAQQHPAASRVNGLLAVAEAVVADLEPLQNDVKSSETHRDRQERVAKSLPLAISLCDALGLIGDDRAMPTLNRIGELRHRRLRLEAAAARIRLAQQSEHEIDSTKEEWLEEAKKALIAMAAEPSVRMRAIAYAEELEIDQDIPEELDSPVARAEGELVAFLTQPTQMGLPPDHCELVDSRTLYWPGYEEPRNCYLFRYEYLVRSPQNPDEVVTHANIGIAGPAAHAMHADLTDLELDDVYAAFAGWQTEHDEIKFREIDPEIPQHELPAAVHQLLEQVDDAFTHVQPRIFGMFFGQAVIVAHAQKNTALGCLVIDDQPDEPDWFPMTNERSPRHVEAWMIYTGKRLLNSFNDDWTE